MKNEIFYQKSLIRWRGGRRKKLWQWME